jgi:hypothetical protein
MTKKEFVSLLGEQASADMAKRGSLQALRQRREYLKAGMAQKNLQ